jgi:hypothetical protein
MQKQLIPAKIWRKEKAAMQIFKVSLLSCACLLAVALNVHAQDNAAQAAARAALAAKLFEMDASSPSPTNNPATKAQPAPAPKAPIADAPPATTVPAHEPVMIPVGGGTNSKADQQAKKDAAKQAAALKAKEDAAAKAQAKADADKAAADAKAQKLAEKQAEKQHAAEVAAAEKQAKLNTDAAMKPPAPAAVTMPDMAAPPPPISAAKQQQLADLLAKYQADQITPDEYQKQRADIMAQP